MISPAADIALGVNGVGGGLKLDELNAVLDERVSRINLRREAEIAAYIEAMLEDGDARANLQPLSQWGLALGSLVLADFYTGHCSLKATTWDSAARHKSANHALDAHDIRDGVARAVLQQFKSSRIRRCIDAGTSADTQFFVPGKKLRKQVVRSKARILLATQLSAARLRLVSAK